MYFINGKSVMHRSHGMSYVTKSSELNFSVEFHASSPRSFRVACMVNTWFQIEKLLFY